MSHSQQALEEFAQDLGQAAAERGVLVTPELVREVYAATTASGEFNPMGMRHAFDSLLGNPEQPADDWADDDPEDWADDEDEEEEPDVYREFAERNAEEAARRAGRPLSQREQEAVWDASSRAAERGDLDPDTIAADAGVRSWSKMDPGEVARVMAERVRDQDPGEDIEIAVDDDGRPDSNQGWNQYMAARVRGDIDESWLSEQPDYEDFE